MWKLPVLYVCENNNASPYNPAASNLSVSQITDIAKTFNIEAQSADATDPIEQQSSRPDLGILCYPVITMGAFTHQGSKNNLLGTNASPELVRELSNELQVTKDTPPCFIWHTFEDKAVPLENSLQFAEALRKAAVPFDLHVYEKGAHGLGLGSREYDPSKWHPWTRDCIFWLKEKGFAK